jgi:hypothetical protein
MVASSFGKLVMKESPGEGLKEEDLAIALLMMITNNIGQVGKRRRIHLNVFFHIIHPMYCHVHVIKTIFSSLIAQVAYLNAQLHNCTKIFFVGNFLRHNNISCRRLAFAISFWSKATMEALFLEHEGYFGALGAFLESAFGDKVDEILGATDAMSKEDSQNEGEGAALRFVSSKTPSKARLSTSALDLDGAHLRRPASSSPESSGAQRIGRGRTASLDSSNFRLAMESSSPLRSDGNDHEQHHVKSFSSSKIDTSTST